MKRLLTFIKPYKRDAVLSPAFKLLEALMDLLVPLVVAAVINRGIERGDHAFIVRAFLLLIALAAAGMAFSFTAQWFAAKASVGFASDLRQALFDHILGFSYASLDREGSDTLITRLTSDVNQVQNGINMGLRLLLRSPFIVFGSMIMSFTIDLRCALIFAAAIPVLGVVVFVIMYMSIPLFARVQAALDELLLRVRENLSGVRVIRAFCKEKQEIRDFDRCNDTLTRMSEFVGRLSALLNPAAYLLINIATIVLIRTGALRVQMGQLSQGDVVAMYNYMAQMIVELVKLASLIITLNRAAACARRIEEVMDRPPGMEYPEETSAASEAVGNPGRLSQSKSGEKSAITFENVSFSYAQGGEKALTGVNFSLKEGQTLGIIGPTGSGKSTLVNLIARFYDVTEGRVLLRGKDVRDYTGEELISLLGIVPQKAVLFEGTLRENMRIGKEDATDREIWRALEIAQAREFVERWKEGLNYHIEQDGRNLSGGQKQRLTIARALVRDPWLLILDDSASALDFATDLKLRKAIRSLGRTICIVSQRAASVRNADLILVLDDGEVVGMGTHEQLMQSCSVYREICASQLSEEPKKNTQPTEAAREAEKESASKAAETANEAGKGTEAARACAETADKICTVSPETGKTGDRTDAVSGKSPDGRESSLIVLKKVFAFIGMYRGLLVLSLFLSAVTVLMQLYVPILFGRAIDAARDGHTDMASVMRYLGRIGLLIAVSSLTGYVMNLINNRLSYRTVKAIRAKAIRKIQDLPLRYLDSHSAGDIVQRVIADTDQIADGLLLGFTQLFSGVVTIIATLIFMLSKNVWITLIVTAMTPVSFLVARFIAVRSYRMFRQQTQLRGSQTGLINEMIGSEKVVKAFGYEARASARFRAINEKLRGYTQGAVFYSSLTNPATRAVNNVIYALVALIGAFRIISGALSVGDLTVLLHYANQYMKPFNDISSVVTELQNALSCAARVFELIEAPSESPDSPDELPEGKGSVDFVHVDFSYVRDKELIRDFNFHADPGMSVAIVGPTGCGKTTLINLLMRFYDADSGTIAVDGRDITLVSRSSLRRSYGMVLQDTWIKSGTVRDNIAFGKPQATDDEIIEAAKLAHSWEFIRRMPGGLDSVINSDSLSQGEKQLLCITRVMLALPPMLILDEATSSIDTRTEIRIQEAFSRMMQGRTSFIVAHRLSTIRNADRILAMQDGKIVEQGTHESLLAQNGFYARLFRSQFEA